MNVLLLSGVFVLLFCFRAQGQITCNQCVGSRTGKGDCTNEVKCKLDHTRCLAIHWGANAIRPNTYDTRCATADECSTNGVRNLCDGKDCEAKCCTTSQCDPYPPRRVTVIRADDRSFKCYQCSRKSLGSCESTVQKCDDDQDACISFLMEGGNLDKVYTKRCSRKDECTSSELDRLCAEEIDQSNRKECRPSCCYDEKCNQASLKTIPMLVVAGALLFALFLLGL